MIGNSRDHTSADLADRTGPDPGEPQLEMERRLDVVVVGGGPAGLNAALILGRCRRSVVVCDSGQLPKAASSGLHGFLSRDGTDPAELRAIARQQLAAYPTVEVRDLAVVDAARDQLGFEVELETGERLACRKLLLATGAIDDIPRVPGMRELFGRCVFICPVCDGWEVRDSPVAVYGWDVRAVDLALELTIWSRDVLLCTDGRQGISGDQRDRLARQGVWLREEQVVELVGREQGRVHLRFSSGGIVPRRALFLAPERRQRSGLLATFGWRVSERGVVQTKEDEARDVPGLFVAGDASGHGGLTILAAADGARVALAINNELLREELPGWREHGCCGWDALAAPHRADPEDDRGHQPATRGIC